MMYEGLIMYDTQAIDQEIKDKQEKLTEAQSKLTKLEDIEDIFFKEMEAMEEDKTGKYTETEIDEIYAKYDKAWNDKKLADEEVYRLEQILDLLKEVKGYYEVNY